MYIDIVPNRNSPPAVLLRESYREGKKVLKRTIANLSDGVQIRVGFTRDLAKHPIGSAGIGPPKPDGVWIATSRRKERAPTLLRQLKV
jgi:hypothetical protein